MEFQAYTIDSHPEFACIQVTIPDSQERTPTHITCVIDTSASMQLENKLNNVKDSLHFLLDFLGPNDQVSIVTFSNKASTILCQNFVSSLEKENIRARISMISIEANTNLSAGIIAARACLHKNVEHMKQGILILTDGIANMGITRPDHIVELVTKTIETFPGTSISCIGYGTDHNVNLLQSISGVGGGSYYVVNSLEDVATVFGDIIGGLVSCSFQQMRVILPLDTPIRTRYAIQKTDTHIEVVIGDLPSGTSAVFLATIPLNTSVILKGFNLTNLFEFERTTRVTVVEDETLQTNGDAHYLRFEVISLIEDARQLMKLFSNEDKIKQHINKIDLQLNIIQDYKKGHPHSLWDVLLDELQRCKRYMQNYKQKPSDVPNILSQHSSYLGRMRGTPSSSSSDQLQDASPHAFSNAVQRQISESMSLQMNPDSQEDEPGAAPLAAAAAYIPRL